MPASEISFRVDLERPMVLSREQQNSIRTLEEIDIPDMPQDFRLDQLPVQPFYVPSDCMERYTRPPQQCRARSVVLKYVSLLFEFGLALA